MILALHSAATGMEAQQMNLTVISNNIANSQATGFKKSKVEFQDLLYQKLGGRGAQNSDGSIVPVAIEAGNGVRVAATPKVFSQGMMRQTGEELDLALVGDGKSFLAVQLPDGTTTAYTRDGALKVDSTGNIVTSSGYAALSGFQTVQPGSRISVTNSGEVSVTSPDGAVQTYRLNLYRFPNPVGLDSVGDNLYVKTTASGDEISGNPGEQGFDKIRQGWLELSNVNAVEEMVNLIIAQRAFEINSKSIQSADEALSKVAMLKR